MNYKHRKLYHDFDMARIRVMHMVGYGLEAKNNRDTNECYGSPERVIEQFTHNGAFNMGRAYSYEDISQNVEDRHYDLYVKAQTYLYHRDGKEDQLVLWKLALRREYNLL